MEEQDFKKAIILQNDNFELYELLTKLLTIDNKKKIIDFYAKKENGISQLEFNFNLN